MNDVYSTSPHHTLSKCLSLSMLMKTHAYVPKTQTRYKILNINAMPTKFLCSKFSLYCHNFIKKAQKDVWPLYMGSTQRKKRLRNTNPEQYHNEGKDVTLTPYGSYTYNTNPWQLFPFPWDHLLSKFSPFNTPTEKSLSWWYSCFGMLCHWKCFFHSHMKSILIALDLKILHFKEIQATLSSSSSR